MRYVLIVLGVIALAVVVVLIIGWRLPVKHTAARDVTVQASPDSVYRLISTVDEYPKWRAGVKSIERTDSNGVVRFRENGSDGPILFEVTESVPGKRFVTRIADPELPFGGRWIYEITPAGTGSKLTITEDGEVYNPLFRFVSRYIMGHTATLDSYLSAVKKALG